MSVDPKIVMKVNNRIRSIATKASGNILDQAVAAGAAQLQRAAMQQAMSMAIIDTGNLIMSHTRRKIGPLAWQVVSPAEYSVYVHMGTKNMPARPWLEIAVRDNMPPIIAMIRRAMKQVAS